MSRHCTYCGASDDEAAGAYCSKSPATAIFPPHDFSEDPPEPEYAPYQPLSIEWWIERVDRVVQESAQVGSEPILSKAAVMAQLYTVQVMERQAVALEKIGAALETKRPRDLNEASADALDKLWKEIILTAHPNHGDWEYPGQVYRDIREEFDSLRRSKVEEKTLGERVRAE